MPPEASYLSIHAPYLYTHYFQIGIGAALGAWLVSRMVKGGLPLVAYLLLVVAWPFLVLALAFVVTMGSIGGVGYLMYKLLCIKVPPPPSLSPSTREPKLGLEPTPALPPGKSKVPRPGEE